MRRPERVPEPVSSALRGLPEVPALGSVSRSRSGKHSCDASARREHPNCRYRECRSAGVDFGGPAQIDG